MRGRVTRAMRAKAAPFGVRDGNRTRVISSSMRFACSKATDGGHRIHERNDVVSRSPRSRQGGPTKCGVVMDEDNMCGHRVKCGANSGRSLSRHNQSRERTLAQGKALALGSGVRNHGLATNNLAKPCRWFHHRFLNLCNVGTNQSSPWRRRSRVPSRAGSRLSFAFSISTVPMRCVTAHACRQEIRSRRWPNTGLSTTHGRICLAHRVAPARPCGIFGADQLLRRRFPWRYAFQCFSMSVSRAQACADTSHSAPGRLTPFGPSCGLKKASKATRAACRVPSGCP